MTKSDKSKWIHGIVDKWRGRLFLGEWFLDFDYAHKDKESERGSRPAAECNANPVYKQALITIYPVFWAAPIQRREFMLVHELSHCHTEAVWRMLTDKLNGEFHPANVVRNEIETLTQRIANICFQQEWTKCKTKRRSKSKKRKA